MDPFEKLKKTSQDLNDKLVNSLKEEGSGGRKEDDRFWYPSTDANGNGSAIIRFLPAPVGEEDPYVKLISHGFKDPKTGRWYIENSLATIGKPDPVGEYNSELWNTEVEANREIARRQKRRTNYFSNVYIIKDSQNPDVEGQVKLFKYGPWCWNFVKAQLIPEFDDQVSVPVFDLWRGANFRIRIGKKGEHRDYAKSSWDAPAPLFDDDEKMKEIWQECHSLQDFISPDKFKTYDELKTRLYQVIGVKANEAADHPAQEAPTNRRRIEEKTVPQTVEDSVPFDTDEDESDIDFFARLAAED